MTEMPRGLRCGQPFIKYQEKKMIDERVEIIFNRKITSGIFLMGLRAPRLAAASSPGQFVMVRVNEGIDPLLRRPLSICGAINNDDLYLLYKVIGQGTEIMSMKRPGDILSVLGPLGQGFSLPGDNGKSILVAGGIGAAPLYFLATALKNKPVTFMAGFATAGDIIPFQDIAGQPMDISIATDDGSEGYSGFVTGLLEEYLDKNNDETVDMTIYTCGPMQMMKRVSSIASSRGIKCQVSLEALMACGLGACQGCAVKTIPQDNAAPYRHVCKDGPVFQSQLIDWSNI
jgi:dihydroorotate dehydrogenase electron transfer subunit